MFEVRIGHPVGEALPADTDALKHTVTGQLMHNQRSLNHTCENANESFM